MKTGETLKQLEERLGITETRNDCPPERWIGDDNPTSSYYLDEEPNFEESHRKASKALAILDKYLKT